MRYDVEIFFWTLIQVFIWKSGAIFMFHGVFLWLPGFEFKEATEDPCVAADGYTYDRKSIAAWLEEND